MLGQWARLPAPRLRADARPLGTRGSGRSLVAALEVECEADGPPVRGPRGLPRQAARHRPDALASIAPPAQG
eukprot:10685211-Lingulodinium_polyedra.AAC.1